MRPGADLPKRETFTAEERQQLIELGQQMRQAAGKKTKQAARLAISGMTPEQQALLVRWLAYRLSGGR